MDKITMNYYEDTGEIVYFSDDWDTNRLMRHPIVQDIVADLIIQVDDATSKTGEEKIFDVRYKDILGDIY